MSNLARATKYLIILCPLLLLPLLLQLSVTSPRNVIGGDFISLTKEISNDAVQKSGIQTEIKKIRKEKLEHRWTLSATLPDGVRIWKNYTRFFVFKDENFPAPLEIYKGDAKISQRSFLSDWKTPAGYWDSYDNQIFLSTTDHQNPNGENYYADYSTFQDVDAEAIRAEVLIQPVPFSPDGSKQELNAYTLSRPLWSVMSHQVRLTENGQEIPFDAHLLEAGTARVQQRGWNYLDDLQISLHNSGVLRITSDQPEYSLQRYLRSGLAQIVLQAKADFKEEKMPVLLIYLGNHLMDRVEIRSDGYAEYSTKNLVIPQGDQQVKFVLEETVKNRNVSILELSLHYPSTIIVNGSAKSPALYTIDYPAKCPFLTRAQFYRKFSTIPHEKFVWDVHHGREVRKALVLNPNTRILYPVKIPVNASLRFGYAYEVPRGCEGPKKGTGRLVISVKEPFQSSRKIFSADLDGRDETGGEKWMDETVNLQEFGGKPVELSLEILSSGNDGLSQPLTFISEPVIASQSPSIANLPEQIIVISADALRADHLGSYGYARKTSPNLDNFANNAVLFENAVSPASWTLPSFSSLFTSVYPSFHRAYSFDVRPLTSELSLIPEIEENGYATAAFVNNPCLYPLQGFSEGFDRYDYGIRNEEERIQHAMQWIRRMKNQRFFLLLHLMKPHEPYAAPEPYSSAFLPVLPRKIETSTRSLDEIDSTCKPLPPVDLDYVVAQYDAEILYMDHLLSKFFEQLKQMHIYENALIVFLSDHGEEFREHQRLLHGTSAYQEQIHVPLILKFPENYNRKHIRIPDFVQTIDVLPTVLDVIRTEPPKYVQGKSLLPMIGRSTHAVQQKLLISETQIAGKIAMVQGRYKYLFTSDPKEFEASAVSCSLRKDEELYDLQSDPHETKDLLTEQPEIADRFRKERLAYEKRVAEFLKQRAVEVSRTPYVLDETVKEELRALGYIN